MASDTATSNECLEPELPNFSKESIVPTLQKDPENGDREIKEQPNLSNESIVPTLQKDPENGDKEINYHCYNKLCVLNDALLSVFSTVGAVRRVYDVHEVLDLLEKYLSKNKSLIDPFNPKFINCANTDLGLAFGVDKFEFKDVGKLLAKNVTAVNSTDPPVGSKSLALNPNQNDAGQNYSREYASTFASDNILTISCTTNNIVSVPSTSHCSSQKFRKLNDAFKITVPEIPDYLSGPESEHSYQGYETAVIDDSDSDIEEKSVHVAQEEVEEEVEEYEIASETETEFKSQNDTESDFENIVLIFGVEERENSDEDCFADHSSSSSSSDSEGVSTEDEKDQWPCVSCGIKNKPFMRYCEKCWQLRKDWYPDPPKRHRKRKPRVKKDKKRLSGESDEQATNKKENVNKNIKTVEVNDKEEEIVTEDGKEEEENEDDKGTLSDTLVRSSSIASTSTVSSVSSVTTACSQDSGFGSQELSSIDICIPISTKKRKASECEEGKRKVQKTVDDVEEIANKLIKKLTKFSKTSKGIRWLKSEAAKDLLELIEDSSSDSDCEVTQDVCSLCYSRPKDASIIHGRLSHIGFCYPCAKRLYNSNKKCPICRRKIHMITKNAYV